MDIAITGATGFIGQALTASLRTAGHHVIPVVRSGHAPGTLRWDPDAGTIDASGFEGLDVQFGAAPEQRHRVQLGQQVVLRIDPHRPSQYIGLGIGSCNSEKAGGHEIG